jgi:hypothetical protein
MMLSKDDLYNNSDRLMEDYLTMCAEMEVQVEAKLLQDRLRQATNRARTTLLQAAERERIALKRVAIKKKISEGKSMTIGEKCSLR